MIQPAEEHSAIKGEAMDCWRTYEALIRQAVARGGVNGAYCETHHILPRSLGGGDEPSNLVELHYREHFLAHWLLSRMFVGLEKKKMVFAFFAMTMLCSAGRTVTSWQYDLIKRLCKAHKLSTRQQRDRFAQQQRLLDIKQIVADAKANKVRAFLKLEKLKADASCAVVLRGTFYRDEALRKALTYEGVAFVDKRHGVGNKRLKIRSISRRKRLGLSPV